LKNARETSPELPLFPERLATGDFCVLAPITKSEASSRRLFATNQ
jgi:hypothetical protein